MHEPFDDKKEAVDLSEICFGFDRQTDERSLAAFLRCFVSSGMLQTLVPRLADQEITDTVDFLTGLMQRHLSDAEYHRLFLAGQG